jgi:hypothetical protein
MPGLSGVAENSAGWSDRPDPTRRGYDTDQKSNPIHGSFGSPDTGGPRVCKHDPSGALGPLLRVLAGASLLRHTYDTEGEVLVAQDDGPLGLVTAPPRTHHLCTHRT